MLFFMCFTYIRNLFDKRGTVERGGGGDEETGASCVIGDAK